MLYLKCKGQVMSVDVDERIADQYINANTVHFEFCERWNGMTITAQFTQDGKTYNKLVDEVTSTVILPNEIMAGKVEISAFGVHPVTGVRITTIPVKKTIDKSGFVGDGELSIPPTPDLYAQLLEKVNKTAIPHIGANGNWWFDDWDSGVAATAEVDAARQAAVNEIKRAATNQMLEMDNKFNNTMKDIPETYTELDATVKSLKDTIGIITTFSGSEEFVSIPYEIKSGKTYKVNITSGTMRLFTRATADGATIDYVIGTGDESTAKSAPFTTEFTASADAHYLRVARRGQSYTFDIALADGVCATLKSVKEVTEKLSEIEYVQSFAVNSGYASYPATIEKGKTYLVHLKVGKVKLSTRATRDGATIDTIIGGTGATGDITTKFTATADASYLRVAADTAVEFDVIDCTKLKGQLALLKYNGYNSIWDFRDSVYAPYPQLPANASSESDFDSDNMTTQDIYDYLDALCNKYPQLLTKSVMGADSSGELYVNRYVFADSAKTSYAATIYIGANEHGPTSDPRECAIIAARFIKDLCEGRAKTNPFISAIKDNCKVVVIPVINPWGFDNNSRNNYNNVNINRNYPTPGWSVQADTDKGASAGSEIETQYVVNTIGEFSPSIALDLHCLGHVVSANAMTCAYNGQIKDHTKIENIVNSMRRDYNLNCVSYGQGDYTTDAHGGSYFRYLGIDGFLLEFNSKDDLADGTSVLHSANIMEANYTFMLRMLNMIFYSVGV